MEQESIYSFVDMTVPIPGRRHPARMALVETDWWRRCPTDLALRNLASRRPDTWALNDEGVLIAVVGDRARPDELYNITNVSMQQFERFTSMVNRPTLMSIVRCILWLALAPKAHRAMMRRQIVELSILIHRMEECEKKC
jgi:hypothetical protein